MVRTLLGAAIRGGSPAPVSTVMPRMITAAADLRHPIATESFEAGVPLSVPVATADGEAGCAVVEQDEEKLFSAMREQFR